jgi:hypothetical protein
LGRVHPPIRGYVSLQRENGEHWLGYFELHPHLIGIKKTYTGMNMRACSDEQLQRLESWIKMSRTKINGEPWLLVVEPIVARGKEIYPYYYVVPENRIITWTEPVDGYLLFQECTTAWRWDHKSALSFLWFGY